MTETFLSSVIYDKSSNMFVLLLLILPLFIIYTGSVKVPPTGVRITRAWELMLCS